MKKRPLKVYVAGKISKNSVFKTHFWRDGFIKQLEELAGLKLISFDPAKKLTDQNKPEWAFGADIFMLAQCDVIIVYLSDDISVGGSQEILIAKYYKKPVIALAPMSGKFAGKNVEVLGQNVKNYIHPFVLVTCDVVCNDIEGVAKALRNLDKIKPKTIDIIKQQVADYKKNGLKKDKYILDLMNGA